MYLLQLDLDNGPAGQLLQSEKLVLPDLLIIVFIDIFCTLQLSSLLPVSNPGGLPTVIKFGTNGDLSDEIK